MDIESALLDLQERQQELNASCTRLGGDIERTVKLLHTSARREFSAFADKCFSKP